MIEGLEVTLLRTTLWTTVSAGVALSVLRLLRIHSPRIHRVVWTLVLLQGWALCPLTVEMPIKQDKSLASHDVVVRHGVEAISSTGYSMRERADKDRSTTAMRGVLTAVAWLGGVVVVIGYFVRRYLSMLTEIPLGQAPERPEWRAEWESAVGDMAGGAKAQMRMTSRVGPLCCFVPFAFRILVPRRLWGQLCREQRIAVLRHELAHVSRWDLWKSVGIRILALPQWFNPLAWRAVAAFDEAAEWACDDLVMRSQHAEVRTAYPAALLRIAESYYRPIPGTVAARGGVLATRIRRLVEPAFTEDAMKSKIVLPLLFLGLAIAQSVRIEATTAEEFPVPAPEVNTRIRVAADDNLDGREAELARSGLSPYRVAPPDILLINVTDSDRISGDAKTEIGGEYIVQPDGSIQLGSHGGIDVNGKTVAEIQRIVQAKLQEQHDGLQAAVDVLSYNSKVVYIILDGKSDYAMRMPCHVDTNIVSVLREAVWPYPVNLESAKVHLHRKGKYEDLIETIDWSDVSKNGPQRFLLPGDRIFVRPDRVPSPSPVTTAQARQVADGCKTGDTNVKLSMSVVRDKGRNLEEFESLKRGALMSADADQTLATLRILTRNRLIDTLAAPTIVCQSGVIAHLAIESSETAENEGFDSISVDVKPTVQEDSLVILETTVHVKHQGRTLSVESASVLDEGKTIVVRAHPQPHEVGQAGDTDAIYVTLTPELVR